MNKTSYSLILSVLAAGAFSAFAGEPKTAKTAAPIWEEGSLAATKFEELNKDLGMDEKKKTDFRKLVDKQVAKRQQANEKLQQAISQLNTTSHNVTAKEKEVKNRIEAVEEALKQNDETREDNHKEMQKFLGTIAYGRYLAYEEAWKGEMRGKAKEQYGRKVEPATVGAVPADAAKPAAAASAAVPATGATTPQTQAPAPGTNPAPATNVAPAPAK